MPRQSTKVECVCRSCGKVFHVSAGNAKRGVGKHCSTACRDAERSQPVEGRFRSRLATPNANGCILWTGETNTNGYGFLSVMKNSRRRRLSAHRLAWQFAHGDAGEGVEVCHNCPGGDNPLCCNPAHLFLGSHADNMRDAGVKGQMARGERHHHSKTTEEAVRDIRRRYAAGGITLKDLAAEHHISPPNVHAIITRKTWKHVT